MIIRYYTFLVDGNHEAELTISYHRKHPELKYLCKCSIERRVVSAIAKGTLKGANEWIKNFYDYLQTDKINFTNMEPIGGLTVTERIDSD